MLDAYKQYITIEKFFQDGRGFRIGRKSDYISYHEFVKYFSDLNAITKHNLIIGINFTYGWMPTSFDFCSDNFGEAIEILNMTKQGKIPTAEELDLLKGLLNNSLVGTSKLLHFINPDIIAIWDSRVFRYLTGKEPHDYRIGNYEAFLSYLNFCNYLTQQSPYNQIHDFIEREIGYSMTKFRTAELIMYSNGQKQN